MNGRGLDGEIGPEHPDEVANQAQWTRPCGGRGASIAGSRLAFASVAFAGTLVQAFEPGTGRGPRRRKRGFDAVEERAEGRDDRRNIG